MITSKPRFTSLAVVAAAAVLTVLPYAAFADSSGDTFYNEDVTTPPPPNNVQSKITIELAGDQSGNLDNFWYNSFDSNTDTAPTINVTGGNTYLTYGPGDFTNTNGGHFGYGIAFGTPEPHGTGSPDVLNKSWGSGTPNSNSGYNQPAATITANTTAPSTGTYQYLLVYADITLDSTAGINTEAQDWEEIAITDKSHPSIDIGNYESDPLFLNTGMYMISPTQIPLDQLNATDLPSTDPQWQPIPGITDGTIISAGSHLASSAVPEPASVILLGILSLAGLLLTGRKWRGYTNTRRY